MKKQAEAFPCDTVSCVDVKFSTDIKGSCKTTENFHVHYIAEKEGGGDKFEISFCYFPIQHVFHLLVIKSKGIFIRSFVLGLSFTMLGNLCLTEVRPVFQLSAYGLHNLEGEVLCNTLSTKKRRKEVRGKDECHLRCLDSKDRFGIWESCFFIITRATHGWPGMKRAAPCPQPGGSRGEREVL